MYKYDIVYVHDIPIIDIFINMSYVYRIEDLELLFEPSQVGTLTRFKICIIVCMATVFKPNLT